MAHTGGTQMGSYAPSYLFKNRFGIYYFRVRIPKRIRAQHNIHKTEIKKSLRTKNRAEALCLARNWWVEMARTDYQTVMAGIQEAEDAIYREDKLLAEGRTLLKELEEIESRPDHIPSDTDQFMHSLSGWQMEAIVFTTDYFSKRPEVKSDTQNIPSDKIDYSAFASKVAKEFSKLQNKDKADKQPTPLLSVAYEEFVSTKAEDWGDTSRRKAQSVFNQFLEVVGDKHCSTLSQDDLIDFKRIYLRLPKRTDQGVYKGKSCREIASMDIPASKLPVKNTLVNKLSPLLSFLDACEENFYIDINHRKPFKKYSKKSKKKSKRSKVRVPYTPEDLEKLFESNEYIKGIHKSPAHHWLPLIALFTGARLNEICQLYQNDIREDGGIWYFDFNEETDDKSTKTDASIRYVPIHPELRRLGFLDYWQTIKEGERLFPMLKKTVNGYGDSISKWFGRTYKNKNNCDIIIPAGKMKDFHSFRNTLIDTLKQKGVPVASTREIVGHEDESLTYGGYANVIDLPNRKKIIGKVKYPSVDFSKIRKMEWR